ncbi:hypothetical protein [Massilia sp. TSP1-1-2]|uniref:hypothetical protein n=1 Tax=unclassified Massilia TaxID=2609279 RepID=UPI003CF7C6E1
MIMEEKNIVGLSPEDGGAQSLATRKARLKRQADFYRVGIVHAKAGIRQGARPEALLHNVLDHAGWALRSRMDSLLRPTGISVAAIMPYAVSIIGFITRRRLVKPALGVLAAAGAVAWYVQQRRAKAAY